MLQTFVVENNFSMTMQTYIQFWLKMFTLNLSLTFNSTGQHSSLEPYCFVINSVAYISHSLNERKKIFFF